MKKEYKWTAGSLPELGVHSLAKHQILHSYLKRYLTVLTSIPGMDHFRLSIVDGFAGGGEYQIESNKQHAFGSPLIFLRALDEAAQEINALRTKRIQFDFQFYFVERKKASAQHLKNVLTREGYDPDKLANIHVINDKFENVAYKITDRISKYKASSRAIFLLDQYGYKNIPLHILNGILTRLPRSEIILTLAVDALIDRIHDNPGLLKTVERTGLMSAQEYLDTIEKRGEPGWRGLIQANLWQRLIEGSGANYFTPFFIRSPYGNKAYWLVHLSMHHKARDEMTQLHWAEQNHFVHYGQAGLNMLGFDPAHHNELPLGFDETALERSKEILLQQLPVKLFAERGERTLDQFYQSICNGIPVTKKHIEEVLLALRDEDKVLEVLSEDGALRPRAQNLRPTDIIRIPDQRTFFDYGLSGRFTINKTKKK